MVAKVPTRCCQRISPLSASSVSLAASPGLTSVPPASARCLETRKPDRSWMRFEALVGEGAPGSKGAGVDLATGARTRPFYNRFRAQCPKNWKPEKEALPRQRMDELEDRRCSAGLHPQTTGCLANTARWEETSIATHTVNTYSRSP